MVSCSMEMETATLRRFGHADRAVPLEPRVAHQAEGSSLRRSRNGRRHVVLEPHFWLITTDEDTTAAEIRDRICDIVPGVNCMVIQVNQGSWSGFGPATEKRDMFKWIKNTWGTVEE